MSETGSEGDRRVTLQKIYLRDASVEVPGAPAIFAGDWQPAIDVDLNMRVENLGEQSHHVTVTATVTAKQGENTAYIVEVEQAGVFRVAGFEDEQTRRQVLGAYCPSVLFPYLREAVGDFVQRAGFPHFLLQPVNFEALYARHLEAQSEGAGDEAPAARH